jgi:hypothetical protein
MPTLFTGCLPRAPGGSPRRHRRLWTGRRHLDPSRLAVLCDALLDAGCPADDEILLHLRGDRDGSTLNDALAFEPSAYGARAD